MGYTGGMTRESIEKSRILVKNDPSGKASAASSDERVSMARESIEKSRILGKNDPSSESRYRLQR